MKEQVSELSATKATASNGAASVEAQIEAIRAERAELARRREQREQRNEVEAELAKEQRALADERAIESMVEQYGPLGKQIAAIETDAGVVIVRRPTAIKFRRFQDKGSFASDDVLAFVRPCVVHPSGTELDRILEELPATGIRLANALVTLAGHRAEELGKK